jgi:glycosyltransferase involved in cell wall biosynthesis
MTLRVLYLHQHHSTPAGATATRSHAMARDLAARGHRVTVACGQYAGAVSGLEGPFRWGVREGRVNAWRVREYAIAAGNAQGAGRRLGAWLGYAARASALVLSGGWDVVVASSTPLTVVLPALVGRVPFVFEMRDPWPELPRAMGVGGPLAWGAMGLLASAACRRAAQVVALSEGMAATAWARGARQVAVIPQGADLDLFGPQVAPWRPAEAGAGEVLAVYAGAHGRANGLDQLLDAAGCLRACGEARLRLLLVGEGSEKPRLQARAAAEALGNVTFLDPLPKPRLAGLLAGAQIGLQCLAPVPAFAALAAPNKLMDYLAAGRPVVANLGGEVVGLLEGTGCGVATPPGDAPALAAALRRLVQAPEQRRRMGEAARSLAIRRFDRRVLARQFCEVVEAAARPEAAPASLRLGRPHA